jgi:hypothetical protein
MYRMPKSFLWPLPPRLLKPPIIHKTGSHKRGNIAFLRFSMKISRRQVGSELNTKIMARLNPHYDVACKK